MKLLKLGIAAAAAVLAAGTGSIANAVEVGDGTYTFTATSGGTSMNGSEVYFSSGSLSDWDLVDPSAPVSSGFPLTSANSMTGLQYDALHGVTTYSGDGVYGNNDWSYHILSDSGAVAAYFEIGNNTLDTPPGDIFDGYGDPYGNWALTSSSDLISEATSAPDGGSTIALLGGVLLGFQALRRKLSC